MSSRATGGSLLARLRSWWAGVSGNISDRVGEKMVDLAARGVARKLQRPEHPISSPSLRPQSPEKRSPALQQISPRPPSDQAPPLTRSSMISSATTSSERPPGGSNGREETEGPSAEEAFKEIEQPKAEAEQPAYGGVPVQEAIVKVSQIMRAVFGRNIPDEVYRQISLDPQLPITILTAIGCENEPIEFLGSLSPQTKHWIAVGSFGIFCLGNVAMIMLSRRRPEVQAVIRYQQMTPEQRAEMERRIREEVARQEEAAKRQAEASAKAEQAASPA